MARMMSEHDNKINNDHAAATIVPTKAEKLPGEHLAKARKARGISVEEVAAQIRLTPKQIAALEENDYVNLPEFAITRGFVRMYAKFLNLDPVPLVSMLSPMPTAPTQAMHVHRIAEDSSSRSYLFTSKRNNFLWSKNTVLLAGAALLVIFFVGRGIYFKYSSPSEDAAKIQASTDLNLKTLTIPLLLASQSASAVSEVASTPVAEAVNNELLVHVKKESWVEVKRNKGGVIFDRILPAGSTEKITIDAPSILTVGNASGANVSFRGKEQDLKENTSSKNVARINLE